ncbi:MAG: bifunctional ADP-dependent NAD(P)H-hydrate dehydratase/NAD(P)H-hydrate epimerase [Sediminibacterium sp.]
MKLFSAQQMQQWDAYTIRHEPVASIDLMERAAKKCTDWLLENGFTDRAVKIFCGKGNNGGDGLAIARLLIGSGIRPMVYIIEFGARGTEDFQHNLQQLHLLTADIHFIQSEDYFPLIDVADIVIDALYGSGLNRPLRDMSAALATHINSSGATVIAIDTPSGMFADSSSKNDTVIRAGYTLSFQSLKLCFLAAENADRFGKLTVLNIGLDPHFQDMVETVFEIAGKEKVLRYLKPRSQFSHKGHHGHALLVAGSKGKMGASILAAKACLRSGVGLLTVAVPEAGWQIIQTSVPEAMCRIREEELSAIEGYAAIGIGPGLGTSADVQTMLSGLLHHYTKPMVLDADALNMLAMNPAWLNEVPAGSILTPHPKEFDRLFAVCDNDFDRWNKAVALTKKYPFIIVLKGHYTLVATNGKGSFNITGNAGMAKGGSGDVLTGILTALLAQGYEPAEAAVLGVYLHGLAADLSLELQSMESLLPSDVIDAIGKGFLFLRGQ